MKINTIPGNIGDYIKYDETSSTGLRWIKARQGINVGDEAGRFNNRSYYSTQFNGKKYQNHRIVYFLHYGYCPNILDHRDTCRTNNKINNLREATLSQNQHNRKLNKNNSTGIKGLSSWTDQRTGTEYWQCQIQGIQGKTKKFRKDSPNSFEDAKTWLLNNRKAHHGEFTNNG